MANLENALQELRAEHRTAQLQVEKLDQAISVIESLNGSGTAARKPTEANIIGGFAAENGAGSKSEVGESGGRHRSR